MDRTGYASLLFLFLLSLGNTSEAQRRDISSRTGYACEGSTLTISCDAGYTLVVIRTVYGRLSMRPCHDGQGNMDDWDMTCMSTQAFSIINDMCHERTQCWIPVTNQVLGGDPCHNTPKYLDVHYECAKGKCQVTLETEEAANTSKAVIIQV